MAENPPPYLGPTCTWDPSIIKIWINWTNSFTSDCSFAKSQHGPNPFPASSWSSSLAASMTKCPLSGKKVMELRSPMIYSRQRPAFPAQCSCPWHFSHFHFPFFLHSLSLLSFSHVHFQMKIKVVKLFSMGKGREKTFSMAKHRLGGPALKVIHDSILFAPFSQHFIDQTV